MSATSIRCHIKASRARIYQALLDPNAIPRWMAPTGMTCEVHAFEPREGGELRVSLTYDSPDAAGNTTAHTDTYHGRFEQLVSNEHIVEVVEFETEDPSLQGKMTVTITLTDAGDGTDLTAVHDGLPPGVPIGDNEMGWRMSLAHLAALVEKPSKPSSPSSP